MAINKDKKFVYRIIHKDNLSDVLTHGIVNKHHQNASKSFISIGNLAIIDVRSSTAVRIEGYGNIGDYVPFYFTPRSIMLYNIITGYYAPKVPRRGKDEIVVIRCTIDTLIQRPRWFFTDGQANVGETKHYNALSSLNKIDWTSIQSSNFSKSDGDFDRQRRYQAEFLVQDLVPVECIESLYVYCEDTLALIEECIKTMKKKIPVHIHKPYFFD